MTDTLIVTGERYSGWATVAAWLGKEAESQAATPEAIQEWKKLSGKKQSGKRQPGKKQPGKQPAGNDQCWLLVYASPQQALANALTKDRDNLSRVDELMEEWEGTSSALLDFFQLNRKSSILINVNCLEDKAESILEHCSTLTGENCHPAGDSPQAPDYGLIVQAATLLPNRDRLYRLYDEMQSSATEPGLDIRLAGQTDERQCQFARERLDRMLVESSQESGIDELQENNELLQLQVHQLQEEVEKYYKDKQEQDREIERLKEDLMEKNQEEDEISTLRHSLELSELQITKLQEELEDYFILSRKLEKKIFGFGDIDKHRRPGQFAVAGKAEIIGSYETDGYRDVNLVITDLVYSKGHRLDSFNCKLIINAGQVGLEIRRKDNPDNDTLIEWQEDMQDDHGHFLAFLPQPPDEWSERQEVLRQQLSTNERQLLTGIAVALSDCFKRGAVSTELELSPADQRFWREKSAWLSSLILSHNHYLSVDSVSLVEDYRTEGYSHLWLECTNLQFGQAVEEDYRFKIVIKGDEHRLYYALEFRNQQDGRPPLHAWPTDYQDEWGSVAMVALIPRENATYLDIDLPGHDRQLVAALVGKLPFILDELDNQVQRDEEWQKWHTELTMIAGNTLYWGIPPEEEAPSRLARIPVLRRFVT